MPKRKCRMRRCYNFEVGKLRPGEITKTAYYTHPLAAAAGSTHARMHAVIEGVALIALDVEDVLEL